MGTFQDALALINDPAVEALARDTFLRWHDDGSSNIGRVVVPNVIDGEHFLPAADMAEIIRAVVAVAAGPLPVVAKAFLDECRRHTLRGGPVLSRPGYPSPMLIGRAVDRDRFLSFLEEHYGPAPVTTASPFFPFFSDQTEIEEFVQELTIGIRASDTDSLLMSEFGAWITWREDGSGGPFSWLAQHLADEVRAHLGLSTQSGGEILLLDYHASDTNGLLRPTIADAGLYEYFAPPASVHSWYGRTKPWPDDLARRRPVPVVGVTSHPEALHERISFAALSLPVKVLA